MTIRLKEAVEVWEEKVKHLASKLLTLDSLVTGLVALGKESDDLYPEMQAFQFRD